MKIENLLKRIKLNDGTIIEIPERLSKLKNDVGYITQSRLKTINGKSIIGSSDLKLVTPTELEDYAKKEDLEKLISTVLPTPSKIPERLSELKNDVGYVTQSRLKTINGKSIIGSGDLKLVTPTELKDYAKKEDLEKLVSTILPTSSKIPERLSELKNDVGYVTMSRIKTLNGISLLGKDDIKVAMKEDLDKFIKKDEYNDLLSSINKFEKDREKLFQESQTARDNIFQELKNKMTNTNDSILEHLSNWQTIFEENEASRQNKFNSSLGTNLNTIEELKTKSDAHDNYLTWNE